MSEVIKRDQYGYKIYPLLDGSEVLWAEEERVLFHRASPESMPLTTDADGVFEDLLALVDSLQQQVTQYHTLISESNAEFNNLLSNLKATAAKRDKFRKALEEIADSKKDMSGVLCRVAARQALGRE
ncbi:hypothetical protein ACTP13_25095 [Paenibacillus peoriae]|uniref:hypothetical protein n=1 Tax=Paenibacillus peoriae TaxID=59893 RepID=UPI003F99DCF3